MAIEFTEAAKHGRIQFLPGQVLAFEDDLAEEYFIAAGWAKASDSDPVHTYPKGSVEIDQAGIDRTRSWRAHQKALEVHDGQHDQVAGE